MSNQRIMFLVTLFIVIVSASAAPVDPLEMPTVTCLDTGIEVIIPNYTIYKELFYFDKLATPIIENLKTKAGKIFIPIENLTHEGTIYKTLIYLTATEETEDEYTIAIISKNTFEVEYNLSDKKCGITPKITTYTTEPAVNAVASPLMTIKPDMQIGETSTITVDMSRYTKGAINSCYIQDTHNDENDMSKAYIIYDRCDKSVNPMYIENEKFDNITRMVTAELTGIGLFGTEEVRIMCFMVGCDSSDECRDFNNLYDPCLLDDEE